MRIAVAREIDASENRVAATPETVKKMKGLGADVAVEPNAGRKSGIPDAEFVAAGATVTNEAVKHADVVLKVRRPAASELARYKKGALVIAMMDPYGEDAAHYPGTGHGRAFKPSQSCRLSRGDRRRRRIRACIPDDDDRGRNRARGQGLRDGRRRCRPAGDRDCAP